MKSNISIIQYAQKVGEETPDWSTDGSKMSVYLVPISKLYYNDDNGRISTWVSSYLDDESGKSFESMTIDEYNDIIHEYIKRANSQDSFNKTYNDVLNKGQIRPGVVLADGRVVSGNRRFTVLRELYKNTAQDKFSFFKCFIVDKDLINPDDRKYIKTIERLTQFGVDEKVDYDPIERLVDIYNDLIGPQKLWTIDEYGKKLSIKKSDVELMYNKAMIMADYLNYINKPSKFHIAKQKKLDGPLQELNRVYRKVNTREWNRIRSIFYVHLSEPGDRTRDIRDLVRLYTDNLDSFDEVLHKCILDIEAKEISQVLTMTPNNIDNLQEVKKIDIENTNQFPITDIEPIELSGILSDDTKVTIFKKTYEAGVEKKKQAKVKKFEESLDYVVSNYDDVAKYLNPNEKQKLNTLISKMIDKLNRKV